VEEDEWGRREGEIEEGEEEKNKKFWEELIVYSPFTLLAPLFWLSGVMSHCSLLKAAQQFERLQCWYY
jgi:hypothetical protein